MAKGAVLSLKITGDASGAKRAFDDADGSAGKFSDSMGKIGGLVAGAFAVGAVADFATEAFNAASNLEQMAGSVDAIFGKAAADIDNLAAKAHNSVGLSTADYDQMAAIIGSQLKNAGTPMDQLASKTSDLIQKGADMSAVFGGSAADAVDALSSVMKGEFDPIEKYGVSINQTAINAELASKHQDKLTGAAQRQAQVQAALDIVTRQTAATQGQFAAQGDTAAEKTQKLGAWFDDLKAKIGAGLLPIFSTLATFFEQNIAPALDTLFAKGSPISGLFGEIGSIVTDVLLPAFQNVWAFVQNYVIPIFQSVLTPALSGLKDEWKHVADAIFGNKDNLKGFYDNLKPFLDFVKSDVAPIVGGVLKDAFKGAGDAIALVVNGLSWILDKAGRVGDFLGKLGSWGNFSFGSGSGGGGRAAPARGAAMFGAARGVASQLLTAGSSGGGTVGPATAAGGPVLGGTVVNVTVNGALDPVAVGRQLTDILRSYARTTGGTVAVTM
jgi:hypothetical protein